MTPSASTVMVGQMPEEDGLGASMLVTVEHPHYTESNRSCFKLEVCASELEEAF